MDEGRGNNRTPPPDNWTFHNSSAEPAAPGSNVTYVGFYLHQPSTAAIFIVSYMLIFLVCMVGNGVVCFIVLRSKNMRTVTNLFILNLAVSDLLVGIFCMPTTLLDNIITGELRSFLEPLLGLIWGCVCSVVSTRIKSTFQGVTGGVVKTPFIVCFDCLILLFIIYFTRLETNKK